MTNRTNMWYLFPYFHFEPPNQYTINDFTLSMKQSCCHMWIKKVIKNSQNGIWKNVNILNKLTHRSTLYFGNTVSHSEKCSERLLRHRMYTPWRTPMYSLSSGIDLCEFEAMEGESEATTERILLEPYKYLLQLPGESFSLSEQEEVETYRCEMLVTPHHGRMT